MKRFVSILLCIIIPFWFMIPVNSNALNVQGNEYPDPFLLPPDVDFSVYSYYFLTIHGTSDNPQYRLYCINGLNVTENCLRFQISLNTADTIIFTGSYSSYGVSTHYYSITSFYYNNSSGKWTSSYSSSSLSGFAFDDYSVFDSSLGPSSKYIIGSNCDIYDYSGLLIRAGDYENLCSFFRNGFAGSSNKSEQPTEPITSGSSDTGGVNIDLSFLSDYFNQVFSLLNNVLSNLTTLIGVIGSFGDGNENISSYLDEIKLLISNLISSYSCNLETSVSSLLSKLDEIKIEILNFERYFSEFSAVNGEIANIFAVLSGLNINITNIHNKSMQIIDILNNIKSDASSIQTNVSDFLLSFPSDFKDTINSIKNNVSSIRTSVSDISLSFPSDFKDTINSIKNNVSSIRTSVSDISLSFPSDFKDTINSIKNNVSSIRTSVSDISLSFPSDFKDTINSIKNNVSSIYADLRNFLSNFSVNDFINKLQLSVDSLFEDISLKIGNLTDSDLITSVKSIETAVNSMPVEIEELLKKLFIPKTEQPKEIMNIISEHFGFIHQIVEIGDAIFKSENFEYTPPEYTIKIDSDLFGHFEGKIIDFSIIPYDYIVWFRMLVSGITYYFFLLKVRKRLPYIINGGS